MAIYRGSESTGTATQLFNIDGDKGDITVTNGGDTWTIDSGVVNTSKLGGDITTQGKALLDDATASEQRTTLGLGSAATQDLSVFATAAQGLLADSAVQPGDSVGFADVTLDSLQFTGGAGTEGSLVWNNTDGTVDLVLKGEDVTIQLGQEQVVRVTNATGVAFSDAQVVYVVGSTGNHLDVALAQADDEATSSKTLAVVTESIPHNQSGFATVLGLVRNINTSAFAEGAALWLSDTVAGGITTTRPTAPNHGVFIGWCIRQHATVGSIFVNIHNGYELDEIHDVLMGAKLAGQTLIYDATVGVWKNARLTAGSNITITNTDGGIEIASTGGTGTVTSVSVASANGFAGSVANATTTPAITLSTSVTGLLKGNGTAISAASAGTDYLAPSDIGTTVLAYDSNLQGFVNTFTLPTTDSTNGYVLTTNGSGTISWQPSSTGSMIYPGAGIAVSTGSAWGTSITDNSTNWNTAYSWGNHASAGYLDAADIGSTVQAYDADTAKLDVAQSWTAQQTFKELKDTVHTITDGAAFEIDPANGSIQTVTLGANRTPAATNFEAGQVVLLGIDDGTAYTITWTTVAVTWVKAGGTASAPTLATTGLTWVLLWKVGSTVYGVEMGKP